MTRLHAIFLCIPLLTTLTACTPAKDTTPEPPAITTHDQLVRFFFEWRKFAEPEMKDGVPDYSPEAMAQQHRESDAWQQRLNAVDTAGWPIHDQVDWYLIWAEMNGLDFMHHVMQPWARDPAFYVWFHPDPTDVPAREGPNIHGCIELPDYAQPLSDDDAAEIAARLRKAPAVFEQARRNLTGNARDLWITGIRSIEEQGASLLEFADEQSAARPDLAAAAHEAQAASESFALWLKEQAPSKTGPSGIGKDNYNWCLQKVHLMPHDWAEEERILQRELDRSHASLRLTEHLNRNLPQLAKIDNAEDYDREMNKAVTEYMAFLNDAEIMTVKDYMDPAQRAKIGAFRPNDGIRGFFDEINYRDAMVMRTHSYHWIELARLREEPYDDPIRQTPLLFNIFDCRAEGLATAMEELLMHAGLFENRPRAKELVWIMLAERCARGLGGLYQHGLEMDYQQACEFASKWTPRGYLPADGGTITHEEQFYLQQPPYGSSYVTGKLLLDQLLAEYARQRGDQFTLKGFMDDLNRAGIIPVSLLYWEMTGDKSLVEKAAMGG